MVHGIPSPPSNGSGVDLATALQPGHLKKRSRPTDHWHVSVEHGQNLHHHHHHYHHTRPGHHVRKKHVTESMAIDFELLSLESGHFYSPSLKQLHSSRENVAPASPLPFSTTTESSPASQRLTQFYDDNAHPRAGFTQSDTSNKLVSARATFSGEEPTTGVDSSTLITTNAPSPYQHPIVHSSHQQEPPMPQAWEKGNKVDIGLAATASVASPSHSSSLPTTTLSAAVLSTPIHNDAGHGMTGMDLVREGGGETVTGGIQGEALWRAFLADHGASSRNHPNAYASSFSTMAVHSRAYAIKPATQTTTMRQRKWNSVTKTWQEWRDVPAVEQQQVLEGSSLNSFIPQEHHQEATSNQGLKDIEISDAEFSDIEDLGTRHSTHNRFQQRRSQSLTAMDYGEMTGAGGAEAYVSSKAFGKSKKPHDGSIGSEEHTGLNINNTLKLSDTLASSNAQNGENYDALPRRQCPEHIGHLRSLQNIPGHHHQQRSLSRLEESEQPLFYQTTIESNGREADPMADGLQECSPPPPMPNTRVRSLSETYLLHHHHHHHNNRSQHPSYHHQQLTEMHHQPRWQMSGRGVGVDDGGNTDLGATSPMERHFAQRIYAQREGTSLPFTAASPLSSSMAKWRIPTSSTSVSAAPGSAMDVIDELSAFAAPGTDNQPSREFPLTFAAAQRCGVVGAQPHPLSTRRPRSPIDYPSPRPPSPRSGVSYSTSHQHHLHRLSRHVYLTSPSSPSQMTSESWMATMGRDSILHDDPHSSNTTTSSSSSGGNSSSGEMSRSPSFSSQQQAQISTSSTTTTPASYPSTSTGGIIGTTAIELPTKHQLQFWSPHNLADLDEQTEGDSMDLE